MKRITLIALCVLMALSFGAANASELKKHKVVKGDCCISRIAVRYSVSWKRMAQINNLKSPYVIHVGDKLKIPAKKVAKPKREVKSIQKAFARWEHPAQNPYMGGAEQAMKPESRKLAFNLLGLSDDIAEEFEGKIERGEFDWFGIYVGFRFDAMVFGKKKPMVTRNLQAGWKDLSKLEASRKYVVERGEKRYELYFPLVCGNWAINVVTIPMLPPPAPPEKGRILIKKEAIDFEQEKITPMPQFTFVLDDNADEVKSDAEGNAAFENVEPGTHTVSEIGIGETWEVHVTPEDGNVEVGSGQTASVHFKNIQKLPPAEVPPEEVPPPEKPPEVIPPTPAPPTSPPPAELPREEEEKVSECYGLEHEPSTGTGGWRNGLARGHFVWGDHVSWYQGKCDSPIWWGLGLFGVYDSGNSRSSSFEWRGYRVSPQLALKGYYPYTNGDGKSNYRSWQLKFRFPAYDVQRGDTGNGSPKFRFTQRNFPMLGIWAEFEQGINRKWSAGLFTDFWIAFDKERHATFAGHPEGRNTWMGGVWAQRKLSENWAIRMVVAPFWQSWDHLFGFHNRIEARYWDGFVSFGPFANLFPRRSAIYKRGDIPLRKLHTWGGFVRVELRVPLQMLYNWYRTSEVVPAPAKEGQVEIETEDDSAPEETQEVFPQRPSPLVAERLDVSVELKDPTAKPDESWEYQETHAPWLMKDANDGNGAQGRAESNGLPPGE